MQFKLIIQANYLMINVLRYADYCTHNYTIKNYHDRKIHIYSDLDYAIIGKNISFKYISNMLPYFSVDSVMFGLQLEQAYNVMKEEKCVFSKAQHETINHIAKHFNHIYLTKNQIKDVGRNRNLLLRKNENIVADNPYEYSDQDRKNQTNQYLYLLLKSVMGDFENEKNISFKPFMPISHENKTITYSDYNKDVLIFKIIDELNRRLCDSKSFEQLEMNKIENSYFVNKLKMGDVLIISKNTYSCNPKIINNLSSNSNLLQAYNYSNLPILVDYNPVPTKYWAWRYENLNRLFSKAIA